MFTLKFETDNDAFAEDAGEEISRILTKIAGEVSGSRFGGVIWDINGNAIGNWYYEADETEDESDDGDGMTDAEADADTLRSAGMGTDEDYGYFGGDE